MTIICSICIDNLSESDSVSLPCGHAFDRVCILQCLRSAASCPLCKQDCTISQVRRLYLSTEANDSSFDQCDLVWFQQNENNRLSKELDMANTKLLLGTETLKITQDKYDRLQRDHKRIEREVSQAAERITQLTEVNRNSKLAYNHLLEENTQYRRKLREHQEVSSHASKDQWWKQLKEQKSDNNDDIHTEIKKIVSKQKKEQKNRRMTYNVLQAQVNDSVAKNKHILRESKENDTNIEEKTLDLLSARKEAKNSIRAFKSSWSIVEDDFKDLLNNYNDVKEEFDMMTSTSSNLYNSIVKFNNSVLKTRSAHDEMQRKMNSYNAISNNGQPLQRGSILLLYQV